MGSTLLFVGCGGCIGDTSSSANDKKISSGILNANLSGKLLFEHDNNAWLMDMSSGQYSKIPNTNWLSHDHIFANCDDFWLDVGPNNNEFTVTSLDDCSTTGPYYRYEICVGIQDMKGRYLANYKFLGTARSPAKLSFDHRHFAIINENKLTHDDRLQIYNRSGQLISSRIVSAGDFEWLKNNRIIYTTDHKFVITEELSTKPDRQLTFRGGLKGKIGSIEVNSNSDKIVFTIVTGGTLVSTHATPWVVNIDGTDLRRLAVSTSASPPPSITSPKWSPDGEWILLREGAFTGATYHNPGSSGYAYLVPAQKRGKPFVLSVDGTKRSPEVFFLNRYERIRSNPSGSVVNKHFSVTLSWIP